MAQGVVDDLETIKIDENHRGAIILAFAALQALIEDFGEIHPVGQAGQRVVVGQMEKPLFRLLRLRDIGKHRNIVLHVAGIVENGRNAAPLRINLAIFAPIPDFSGPAPLFLQEAPQLGIKMRRMHPRLEQARALPEGFTAAVAGDFGKGPVDRGNASRTVGHHDRLGGLVENHLGGQALPGLGLGGDFTEHNDAAADLLMVGQGRAHILQQHVRAPLAGLDQLRSLTGFAVLQRGDEGAAKACISAASLRNLPAKDLAAVTSDQFLFVVTEDFDRHLVGVNDVAKIVDADQALARRLKNLRVATMHILDRQLIVVALCHIARIEQDLALAMRTDGVLEGRFDP